MSERPTGELEFRAATLSDVRYPERILEVVVMPYEDATLVNFEDRMVTEIISRGAFDGIQRRPNRIKANRDHVVEKVVGKAISLHPEREEGLVAQIKISKTDLGDETLTLAADGVLDVSAGFLPMAGGEVWETRNQRRIIRAWLGHVSLVPEAAYEKAKVLSIRQQDVSVGETGRLPTPNLDEIRSWQLEQQLARLSRSS